MNLDTLIADAKALKAEAKKAKAKPKPKPKDSDYVQTVEYIRQLKLERCRPISVHLYITVQKCTCGHEYESVNQTPLLKRQSDSLTHFEPCKHPADYTHLPSFIERKTVHIDWCEHCFSHVLEPSHVVLESETHEP